MHFNSGQADHEENDLGEWLLLVKKSRRVMQQYSILVSLCLQALISCLWHLGY